MSELSRQLPPLSTLVVFEAAARLESFSRAADECALSQASVSRQMRQLEENLEVILFERQRYQVSPTEEGKQLYVTVRRALTELASNATELRAGAQRHNSFTIYSDLSIGTGILAPLIGRLQGMFPEVKFNILSSYDPIEHTRSTFDIGFQAGRRAEELFDVETIADDLVFPVCSPQLAETLASEVTAVELNKLPLLHWDYDNKQSVGWSQFLASYRIRQNTSIEGLVFSSYQVCLDVAEQGEGVALGWARSVKHRIDEGKLIRITDMSLHVPDGIAVYLRKHVNSHPLASQVINEVRNSISLIGSSCIRRE